ncbi:hypothetical protein [Leptolyngbya sp. O-77]|uniref:hypothetical protein n=1 Tax=Leptolyngbya sp. O-77 TaxID=1080068 RepID=UPI00074D4150|nr:hypothetical protein [Leptolyngbya sp. O-77]BAU44439.1 hypothetical protein O77CONTIG1_04278 [Leptolyngbya sp. O-77]
MMTDKERYEAAKSAAGEAIDAILTCYWEASFQCALFEERLAETIHFFTRNARSVDEPPNPEWIAELDPEDVHV